MAANTPLWDPALFLRLRDGSNALFNMDFNRLRYKKVPQTTEVKLGKVIHANRDALVQKIFECLMKEEDLADATKTEIFVAARRHFILCDDKKFIPFSQKAIVNELQDLHTKHRRGQLKDSTVINKRAKLSSLLRLIELPYQELMHLVPTVGRTQTEPFQAYSDADLKKLLPLLRSIFKQLSKQFLESPKTYLNFSSNVPNMTFKWHGQHYIVAAGVNKIISSASYLLSYYTWSNASVLYKLIRPEAVSHSLSETWHQMPAFKRRAFKTLTVEIGANNQLEIPKYALQFFDQLLKVSIQIAPEKGGLLLPFWHHGRVKLLDGKKLAGFKKGWLSKNFPMIDCKGENLTPVVQRFRATGALLMLARGGIMESAIALGNTPQTVARHYSSGNAYENDKMLQETSLTLEYFAKGRSTVAAAKKKAMEHLNVTVLTYEDYISKKFPIMKTPNGSYCLGSREKTEKFTKKATNQETNYSNSKLACADLLACWSCPHQVLVNAKDDIWCILSFREHLADAQSMHLDESHFNKTLKPVIDQLDSRLKMLSPNIVRQATKMLENNGRHPAWPDVYLE